MAEQLATRDWHTRAIVRVLETTKGGNPEGGTCTFHAGQEVEMVQWGRAGRPIDRSRWWSNFDIDGAYIVKDTMVEIIKIIEETPPGEAESEATNG